MQCYLLQHALSHDAAHEAVQECQLCLGAQYASDTDLPVQMALLMPLVGLLLLVFTDLPVIKPVAVRLRPHPRAPPYVT